MVGKRNKLLKVIFIYAYLVLNLTIATIDYPLSTINYYLDTIQYQLTTIHYKKKAVAQRESTAFWYKGLVIAYSLLLRSVNNPLYFPLKVCPSERTNWKVKSILFSDTELIVIVFSVALSPASELFSKKVPST